MVRPPMTDANAQPYEPRFEFGPVAFSRRRLPRDAPRRAVVTENALGQAVAPQHGGQAPLDGFSGLVRTRLKGQARVARTVKGWHAWPLSNRK